jgi:hypothetical protein
MLPPTLPYLPHVHRFRLLRWAVKLDRLVKSAARRVAVACSFAAWLAGWCVWWAALTGVAWLIAVVALVVSAVVAAAGWLISGE